MVNAKIIKLLQGDSLKAKSARGIVMLSTGAGVERLLRLVRTMILTRIIAIDQFGLMSIILVLVTVFEQLSEVGIKLSVIQNKRGSEPEYLNATWWLQAVRGLALFAIAMIAAPLISSFYDKPHLLKLLQVSLLSILFRGFISPRAYVLQKEYKFGLMVLYIQGSALLGTIVTLVCAYYLRNVWALVIGYVTEDFFLCFLSYTVAPFKPRLGIDRSCLKELTAFARGMLGMPIISLIGGITPIFVLGKLVSEEALGLYTLGGQFAGIPLILFNKAISPVILPGFVRKQHNRVSLCDAVLQTTKILVAIVVPLVAYMIVCVSGFLLLLWGPQYVDVAIPCVLLCLLVIVKVEAIVLSSVYVAVGKPHLQRNFVMLQTLIVVLLIYPAVVHWGLVGAALTSLTGSGIALLMQAFWCRRVIDLHFEEYIKGYLPGLLMAFLPVITVFILTLSGINSLLLILISGALALLISYAIYFGRKFIAGYFGYSLQGYKNTIIPEKISTVE